MLSIVLYVVKRTASFEVDVLALALRSTSRSDNDFEGVGVEWPTNFCSAN